MCMYLFNIINLWILRKNGTDVNCFVGDLISLMISIDKISVCIYALVFDRKSISSKKLILVFSARARYNTKKSRNKNDLRMAGKG